MDFKNKDDQNTEESYDGHGYEEYIQYEGQGCQIFNNTEMKTEE